MKQSEENVTSKKRMLVLLKHQEGIEKDLGKILPEELRLAGLYRDLLEVFDKVIAHEVMFQASRLSSYEGQEEEA